MKEHEKTVLKKMRDYAEQAIEFKGSMVWDVLIDFLPELIENIDNLE